MKIPFGYSKSNVSFVIFNTILYISINTYFDYSLSFNVILLKYHSSTLSLQVYVYCVCKIIIVSEIK